MKKIFDVTAFGVTPNSKEIQTAGFQRAVDEAFLSGGGEVMVPEGEYTIGSVRLRSNITLHLCEGAKIFGSRNPMDYFGYKTDALEPFDKEDLTDALYVWMDIRRKSGSSAWDFIRKPGSRWNNAIIRAYRAHNVAIIGENGAVISGSNCYDEKGEEDYRGPHGISMHHCSGIKLAGYTMRDTGNWAHNLMNCSDIYMENIVVLAGHDGFHGTAAENVIIKNCEFYTGDDCIAGVCLLNVSVENCVMNSACSAMRIGGTNISVSKSRAYGPCKYIFRGSLTKDERAACISLPEDYDDGKHRRNMLSFFTYYSDTSFTSDIAPGNISISDCSIENADRLIHYNYSGNEPWQSGAPLSNVRISNVKASGIKLPLTAYGDVNQPLVAVFNNMSIELSREYAADYLVQCANFSFLGFNRLELKNPERLKMLAKCWSEDLVSVSSSELPFDENNTTVKAAEDFSCNPI